MDLTTKEKFKGIFERLKQNISFQQLDPRKRFWEWMTEVAVELINSDNDLVAELKEVRTKVSKGEDRTLGLEIIIGDKYEYKPAGVNKGFHINKDGTVGLITGKDDYTIKLYANEDIFWDFIEGKNRPEMAFWTNQKDFWAEGDDVFRDYYIFKPILKAWGHLFDTIGELLNEGAIDS